MQQALIATAATAELERERPMLGACPPLQAVYTSGSSCSTINDSRPLSCQM